eukprot:tig00021579_g22428.t1
MRRLAELMAACRGALPCSPQRLLAAAAEAPAPAPGKVVPVAGPGWGERHGSSSLSSSAETSEAEQPLAPAQLAPAALPRPRPGPPGPAGPAPGRASRRPPPSWAVPAAHAL